MFLPHRKHTYDSPQPVAGLASLLLFSFYKPTDVPDPDHSGRCPRHANAEMLGSIFMRCMEISVSVSSACSVIVGTLMHFKIH
jgi:hypothetical protein